MGFLARVQLFTPGAASSKPAWCKSATWPGSVAPYLSCASLCRGHVQPALLKHLCESCITSPALGFSGIPHITCWFVSLPINTWLLFMRYLASGIIILIVCAAPPCCLPGHHKILVLLGTNQPGVLPFVPFVTFGKLQDARSTATANKFNQNIFFQPLSSPVDMPVLTAWPLLEAKRNTREFSREGFLSQNNMNVHVEMELRNTKRARNPAAQAKHRWE